VHHPQEELDPNTPVNWSSATNQWEDQQTQPNHVMPATTDENVDLVPQPKIKIVDLFSQPKTESQTHVPDLHSPNNSNS
jgi:hypothetical protein